MVMIHHFAGGLSSPTATGVTLFFSRLTGLGWCGVDLFFVLSGFLITSILYDTKNSPAPLRNFYARRILRIFPLYYGLLCTLFILLPLLAPNSTPGVTKVAQNQIWLWTYSSNFATVFAKDETFRSGLVQAGHFWSLAVEEQFYLLWPFLVLSLRRATLVKFSTILILSMLALRLILVSSGLDRVYYLTPCRLDGLMMGSIVALMLRGHHNIEHLIPHAKRLFAITAIPLATLGITSGLDPFARPMTTIGFTLLAAFFTSILIFAQAGRFARLFNAAFVQFLGKYSYGLYVLHLALEPIFTRLFGPSKLTTLFHHYWPARLTFIFLSISTSILLAYLSWHLYEKQFLKLKRFFDYNPNRTRPTSSLTFSATPSLRPA